VTLVHCSPRFMGEESQKSKVFLGGVNVSKRITRMQKMIKHVMSSKISHNQ
jgi:hypothetical protein